MMEKTSIVQDETLTHLSDSIRKEGRSLRHPEPGAEYLQSPGSPETESRPEALPSASLDNLNFPLTLPRKGFLVPDLIGALGARCLPG